ncbi:MAG: tyrosine-type recombinase/integrase [Armatimonadota bacterium]|nr:tyrosine-type recombinase/integrase [Armatimonadota bacterium]
MPPRTVQTEWLDLFQEYLGRLRSLEYSQFTVNTYRLCLQRFIKAHQDIPLSALTPEHIERYVYGRSVGARTKWHELKYLQAFFSWVVKHKRLLKKNPVEGAEAPRWKSRIRPAPTLEDFLAMRRQCKTLEEAVLLEVYYWTALRYREALYLRLRHVDVENREIRVVKGKGDKDRIVVFPPRLQALLREFLAGRRSPDEWLFISPRFGRAGKRRSPDWVREVLARLGRDAGLPYKVTPHVLRHGWVRMAKVNGMPLEIAAKQLGHSKIEVTSRLYGQVDASDLKAAYDRFLASADVKRNGSGPLHDKLRALVEKGELTMDEFQKITRRDGWLG